MPKDIRQPQPESLQAKVRAWPLPMLDFMGFYQNPHALPPICLLLTDTQFGVLCRFDIHALHNVLSITSRKIQPSELDYTSQFLPS